jgi:ubiquitin C-terminal hydrolase
MDEDEIKYQEVMNDQVYDLFAVVLHTGTLNGGHYTALVKNKKNWYEFNDHQVFLLAKHETSKVISNHAYILFY